MKVQRRGGVCSVIFTHIFKSLIVMLSVMGIFSILSGLLGDPGSEDTDLVKTSDNIDKREATRDRRDRIYEERQAHARSTCEVYEDDITLHTVKMYDLVPPAPIGLNADILVDRVKKFFWCKVPKAASTSWISLLLSDREFANMKVSIGKQHMYLR